jgi:hypothetical protein
VAAQLHRRIVVPASGLAAQAKLVLLLRGRSAVLGQARMLCSQRLLVIQVTEVCYVKLRCLSLRGQPGLGVCVH